MHGLSGKALRTVDGRYLGFAERTDGADKKPRFQLLLRAVSLQHDSPLSGGFVPGCEHTAGVEADPVADTELIGTAVQIGLDFAALGEEPAPAITGAERVRVGVVRCV